MGGRQGQRKTKIPRGVPLKGMKKVGLNMKGGPRNVFKKLKQAIGGGHQTGIL